LCANAHLVDLCARIVTSYLGRKLPQGLIMSKTTTYADEISALLSLLKKILCDDWHICSRGYFDEYCKFGRSSKTEKNCADNLYKNFLKETDALHQILVRIFNFPSSSLTANSIEKSCHWHDQFYGERILFNMSGM
jgi:hypothetical protein